VRDELHTQNLLGILVGLFDGLGQLDAATTALPAENSALAAWSASSMVVAISPLGTATPYLRRISLAWYSWIFMRSPI
jgi:hypothetical protein